jgi:hypothetical protein
MLGMPNRLAPQVAVERGAATCQAILKEAVYEVLSELSRARIRVDIALVRVLSLQHNMWLLGR